jgi:hemoglobin/transferrin/lactoferrin receptor protein
MFKSLGALSPQKKLPSNFKISPLSIGIAAALIFSQSTAFAEEIDAEKRHKIQMIQVVGQATGGLDSVITEEDLENSQANSLGEIFRSDPTVSSGGSVGMSEKIYVRNIGEDIVSITVDGAEQANAVFHHSGRIALEPELIKRVEVEAGAGSATAGPGALGGSVKFTTKDPEDLLKPGKQFGALLKAGFSSNGDGNKNSVTLFGQDKSERFGGMVSFMQDEVDDVEGGNGEEIEGTNSEQDLGYAKFVGNITDEQYFSLSYEQIEEEGDVLYRPEWVASSFNVTEPTEGERKTTTLNYGFTSDSSDMIDLLVTVYNTEYYQSREFRGTSYDGAVESKGLTIQNTSLINNQKLIYGINYRDDKSHLNDIDFAPGDTYFEETGEVKGIYVQDVITVNDALTVSTGVRFDDYELSDESDQTFSESGASPNISANVAITPQWGVSAGYAEAFRGPEVEDAFRTSSSNNDPDLKAETAKNIELALEYKNNGLQWSAGVFDTTIEDAILRNPPWSNTVTNLEDDIETDGYFINVAYATDRFDFSAKYLSAETEVAGQKATRYIYGSKATSIGDTLVLDLDYRINKSWTAGWVAEFVQDINGIHQDVGGESLDLDKKGYDLHDVYVSWQPLKDDQLKLNLSIHNLFDEEYLSHASVEDYEGNAGYEGIIGSPEAGRDIRLTATWRI